MKISTTFTTKNPGRSEYSSEGFHLSIESEPPPEVAQDREKLRAYIEALFTEVRARVEDQVASTVEREPAPEPPTREASSCSPRRPSPVRGVVGRLPRSTQRAEGHVGDRATARGEAASLKQVSYLRSLARSAGYSNDQLALFVEEVLGRRCSLDSMSKREASIAIESMKANAA